mgnify:FL=1
MLAGSRLAHLGVTGPFSSLGPVSSHGKNKKFDLFSTLDFLLLSSVDTGAMENTARISPENNLDFYPYSQTTPYNVIY